MGYFVPPSHAFRMLGQLNARFAEGDPIAEMVALQKEFSIFSAEHDLGASFSVLGIAPTEGPAKDKWLKYLDYLKELPSSDKSLNGHDLIRQTLQEDLESDGRPVFFQCHAIGEEPRVVVKKVAKAVAFTEQPSIVVTVPAETVRESKQRAVGEAPPSAARRAARAAGKTPAKKAGKGGKASR